MDMDIVQDTDQPAPFIEVKNEQTEGGNVKDGMDEIIRTYFPLDEAATLKQQALDRNVGTELPSPTLFLASNNGIDFARENDENYRCNKCEFTSDSMDKLHDHITAAHKQFVCYICQKCVSSACALKRHMNTVHSDDKPYKCDLCAQAFKQAGALTRHKLVHSEDRPYQCSYCDAAFKQKGSLKTHTMTHTGERPHACHFCDRTFKLSFELKRHIKVAHSDGKSSNTHVKEVIGVIKSAASPQAHNFNDSTFEGYDHDSFDVNNGNNPSTLNNISMDSDPGMPILGGLVIKQEPSWIQSTEDPSMIAEDNNPGDMINTVIKEEPVDEYNTGFNELFRQSDQLDQDVLDYNDASTKRLTKSKQKTHMCSMCLKVFTRAFSLKTHMRAHTGEKPHKCTLCGAAYTHTNSLNKHMQNVHSEGNTSDTSFARMHKCTLCDAEFSSSANLKRHDKRVHSAKASNPWEKSVADLECNIEISAVKVEPDVDSNTEVKEFQENVNLSTYGGLLDTTVEDTPIKQEPEEHPFTCFMCGDMFTYADQLEQHVQCHKDDGDKPKKAKATTRIRQHKCHTCHKVFSKEYALKVHMFYMHTRNKVLTCKMCDFSCTTNIQLKNHSRKHKNDIRCQACDSRVIYASHSDLLEHMQTHVGEEILNIDIEPLIDEIKQRIEKPFCCALCQEAFVTKTELRRHSKTHKGHQCHFCGDSFHGPTALVQHLRIHTGEKPYKCDYCEKYFRLKDLLIRHTRSHTGERPYPCDLCDRAFVAKSELKRHRIMHSGVKPYKCDVCEAAFWRNHDLKVHHLVHTGEKPWKCNMCDKAYRNRHHLRIHKRIHTGEKPYECKVCQVSFRHLESLKSHMSKHTGENPTYIRKRIHVCEFCSKAFRSPNDLVRHIRTHTGEKPYGCDECEKKFTTEDGRRKHKVQHSKPTLESHEAETNASPDKKRKRCHACNFCDKAFGSPNDLRRHVRTHTGEKPYQCEECGKKFALADGLKKHKMLHSDGKTVIQNTSNTPEKRKCHVCEYCEKAFGTPKDLTRHIRTHTGEKPFGCDECEKRFTTEDGLKKHTILYHGGEAPFQCEFCKAKFFRAHDLKVHTWIHTGEKPFKCEFCDKAYKQKHQLTVHMRDHTGEKPYQCDYCHEAFKHKSTYESHLTTHTGVKPYPCKLCKSAFMFRHHLRNHMNTQHKGDADDLE